MLSNSMRIDSLGCCSLRVGELSTEKRQSKHIKTTADNSKQLIAYIYI